MKSNLQLKNLRHKFSWLLCLVVSLCSANALAAYYMPGSWPGGSWGFGDYNKFVSNKITMSLAANTTYDFKITNGNSWNTSYGVNDNPTMERSTADGIAWTFNGGNNCKIKTDIAGTYTFTLNTIGPTLTVTYPTPVQTSYYLKHPWGGGDWNWSEALTDNGDGTYSIDKVYGGSGCNWNTSQNDTGAKWIGSPTLEGGPTSGDNCVFTLNPSAGTITITKKNDCNLPTVTTVTATSVGRTSATVGGSYIGGDETPSEVGIEWVSGKSGKVIASSVATPFTVDLSDLTPGTTYTYKAYAVACDANITYGSNESFTTPYRCYDGTEYMYFDIKGSYFSSADAIPNVSFDGGNTYTDATVVDAENKIYKLLVPAGCYNSMIVRRHGSSYWNQCDISLIDIENHNEFIVGSSWSNCDHSWGDYEEQICTAPVASNFTVTDATKTYNGSAQTATITADPGMGTMTVKYAGSTTAPTNAGTYAITVDVAKGTTYCAANGIALGDFTIIKADQTELTLASSAVTVCSGNSATLSTTGGSGDGAVTYAITSGTGGSISGNTLTATQAGTFTVQATKAASTNYNAKTSNEVTVTFVAIPATPNATDISVCSGEDATFNATSASGASIDWYDVASGGTLLKENSNNYVVANLTVAKTVYAEAHNLTTGCVSAARKAVAATIKGATLTVSPSSVSTNPYAVTTLTATSTPAESVTWSTTTGYFVDENNKKSDAPVANSVKVKPGETGGNVTATVVSGGCTTNTIVPVTVTADTQDCQ